MRIKVWTKDPNMAAIEFNVPVTSEVEIHLFPGDKPTIESHNTRSVDEHKCRSFDVIVKPNGELMMDWVNVTQTADSTVGKLIERHVKSVKKSRSKYNPRVFAFRRCKRSIGINSGGDVHRNGEYLPERSAELTAFEEGIIHGVAHLQTLNSGFARVWGGAEGHRAVFNLSVEFIAFDDDKEGWKKIRAWIKQHGGIENEMDHCQHLDKTRPAGAKRWKLGKDHGRWETQIDVTWDVTYKTKAEVAAFIDELRESVKDDLWPNYGMSVS